MATTYDVRIWSTSTYRGARSTTYYVRWRVGDQPRKEPFKTKALAESFRSELVAAARKGEAFDLDSGLPVSMSRTASARVMVRVRLFVRRHEMAARSRHHAPDPR